MKVESVSRAPHAHSYEVIGLSMILTERKDQQQGTQPHRCYHGCKLFSLKKLFTNSRDVVEGMRAHLAKV